MRGLILGRPRLGAVLPEFGRAHIGNEIPCCAEHSSFRRLCLRDSLHSAPQSPHNLQEAFIRSFSPFLSSGKYSFQLHFGKEPFQGFSALQAGMRSATVGWYPKADKNDFCFKSSLGSGREGGLAESLGKGQEYRAEMPQWDPSRLRVCFGCCKGLMKSEVV